jgi:hypothetical protein
MITRGNDLPSSQIQARNGMGRSYEYTVKILLFICTYVMRKQKKQKQKKNRN